MQKSMVLHNLNSSKQEGTLKLSQSHANFAKNIDPLETLSSVFPETLKRIKSFSKQGRELYLKEVVKLQKMATACANAEWTRPDHAEQLKKLSRELKSLYISGLST